MAMHALTRQSKIRHSASGGKYHSVSSTSPTSFLMAWSKSPSFAYSVNMIPSKAMRLFAILCASIELGLCVGGPNF